MPKITGITIERNIRGVPRYARIDLKKHPEFIPLLEEKGALYIPNAETRKAMDDAENRNVSPVRSKEELKKLIFG